jgi:hypothetical protein
MSTLSIHTSSALLASSHILITKRSNRNFIKYLVKLGKERCNALEDYETKMNLVNASDYIIGCYKDIEEIQVDYEDGEVEAVHFVFEKNSDTLLNLAYSILIIIRSIVREEYFAEVISGGFNYMLTLGDNNEMLMNSCGYGNVCYDSHEI